MENAQDADSATAIPLNCEEGDDDFIVVTSVQPMEQEENSGVYTLCRQFALFCTAVNREKINDDHK